MEKIDQLNNADILNLYNMVSGLNHAELEQNIENDELVEDDSSELDTCKNCSSTSIYYEEGSYFFSST